MTKKYVDRWDIGCDSRPLLEEADREIEQLRTDISQAYDLRDKAEGRYCTALGTIEQLHAAVKTAQELAARRLMEIERLKGALKRVRRITAEGTTHTGMIAALGILVERALNPGNGPLPPDYTYHSHEPLEQPVATPGATQKSEDSATDESSRPRGLLSQGASRDAPPVTPVPGYRVFDEVSDVPTEVWSASRDASSDHICLIAGCGKPCVIAKDGAVGALCEEHNGNVGLRG
jgi:hypothetical protein